MDEASKCCSLLLLPGIGLPAHLHGKSVVLATSLIGSTLDFPLGESVLEPLPCCLVLDFGKCIGLVESGTDADGVMVSVGGAKAMALCGVAIVMEVTCRPLFTYAGMS